MPQWLMNIGRAMIADDTIRAYLLAYLRQALSAIGAGLVAHGYASNSMVQSAIGFVCAAIAFYGAHHDVTMVALSEKAARRLSVPRGPKGLTG